MKIHFIWQGISGRYGQWKDGLWLAMKHLEKEYDVSYHEPQDEIPEDALVIYWEAPCTINGKDKENYLKVKNCPNKKILLFAGGPLKKEWVDGFDMVCVESEINAQECEEQGIPHITAFGINEEIMKPKVTSIIYDGIHHGTCASWKRQWLVGEALGIRGVVVGRYQKEDPMPFDKCKEYGTLVIDEQTPEEISILLNKSHTLVQTSDFWGGGQRATLEAMACGVFPIVMSDSPKNIEFVQESGFGTIVEPNAQDIKRVVEEIIENSYDPQLGIDYIKSKWTSKHYADNLKKAINLC